MAELKFGTSGIRGTMGDGSGRMNLKTIRLVTMGLGKYLKEVKPEETPVVAVSRDSRNNSLEFARETVRTLKGMGIDARMFEDILPVPALSFAVRYLKADAGVMITASHNPKEYNGYKVYGPTGSQILDEAAEKIQKYISEIPEDCCSIYPSCCDDQIEYIDASVYDAYIEAMDDVVNSISAGATAETPAGGGRNACACGGREDSLNVIYTPLNGSGAKPAIQTLNGDGHEVFTVPEQERPDGNFTTCGQPNPEFERVYERALKYAQDAYKAGSPADIIIATDPDADRVGAMVLKNPAGSKDGASETPEYRLLSGNDLGTLVLDYICSACDTRGKALVSSFVSTPLADRVAAAHGMDVKKTPVGFKYIAAYMDELQGGFGFGFEESNGMVAGLYTRDKDGVLGARLVCMAAEAQKKLGKTLSDRLDEINAQYGPVVCKTIDKIVDPDAPKPETTVTDLEDGSRVVVRPSGTEPKIKYYFFAPGESRLQELIEKYSL